MGLIHTTIPTYQPWVLFLAKLKEVHAIFILNVVNKHIICIFVAARLFVTYCSEEADTNMSTEHRYQFYTDLLALIYIMSRGTVMPFSLHIAHLFIISNIKVKGLCQMELVVACTQIKYSLMPLAFLIQTNYAFKSHPRFPDTP